MKSILLRGAALIVPVLFLNACEKPADPNAQSAVKPEPQVEVVLAKSQSVPLTRELVGRLAATRVAQVRARVAGIILTRVYTEGTDVRAGEVLFRIDPAELESKLHAQEAALAKAQADAANAVLTAKRYQELRAKRTLSQQDLDTAQANKRTTAAIVKQARANVETARLNLSYATVTAPISGRAGRALVTEGALVGQNEATQLTTIEQIDPIYVNFSQSVAELIELARAGDKGPGGPEGSTKAKVEILLADGSTYPHVGSIDFSDMAVDPGTGALSLRAVVANPSRRLLPGMFVKLRLTSGEIADAFLIPQSALLRDAAGAYVLVLNEEGKVEQRRVQTRGMTRANWILTGGLADGDQVIVAGLQKVKPGAKAKIASPAAHTTVQLSDRSGRNP